MALISLNEGASRNLPFKKNYETALIFPYIKEAWGRAEELCDYTESSEKTGRVLLKA